MKQCEDYFRFGHTVATHPMISIHERQPTPSASDAGAFTHFFLRNCTATHGKIPINITVYSFHLHLSRCLKMFCQIKIIWPNVCVIVKFFIQVLSVVETYIHTSSRWRMGLV